MSKLLVTLVHLSINDPPLAINLTDFLNSQPSITILTPPQTQAPDPTTTTRHINASESIIQTVLGLLSKRDLINEQSSKYLIQYFQFFNMYISIGLNQCYHLISSDIPVTLIQFALDELPTTMSNVNIFASATHLSGSLLFNYAKMPNNNNNSNNNMNSSRDSNYPTVNSSQYADLAKLFSVVSTLLRCFDLTPYMSSSIQTNAVLPNPFSHYNELKLNHQQNQLEDETHELQAIKLPPKLEEYLFKQSKYIKKLLEDAPNSEDTIKLMKFLSWENMNFSLSLLNELLWMITYHYSYELKPHLDMLHSILMINDSWQANRISFAFNGIPYSKKDGLFEIIASSQNNYQKRGYQIIKMLVQLFTGCELAVELVNKEETLKRKWKMARNWFFSEMEKCRMYNMPNYTYFQSPQSNETSQTYYLERTQSARITLEKAMKIFPASATDSANNSTADNNEAGIEDDNQAANETDNESLSDEDNLEYRMKSSVGSSHSKDTLSDQQKK